MKKDYSIYNNYSTEYVKIIKFLKFSDTGRPLCEALCLNCGKKFICNIHNVLNLHTKSCGCRTRVFNNKNKYEYYKSFENKTYNHLTLIKYLGFFKKQNKNVSLNYFLCKCDCGNVKIIDIQSIVANIRKSCGSDIHKRIDCSESILNNKYGLLQPIEYLGYYETKLNRFKNHWFKCKCDCGNIVDINRSTLLLSKRPSCERPIHRMKYDYNCFINKKFGKLKVIKFLDYSKSIKYENFERKRCRGVHCWFLCECDCGNKTVVSLRDLINNHVISCGCIIKENCNKTHCLSNEKLFDRWSGLNSRCFNENDTGFFKYGERGIFVCKEWIKTQYWSENDKKGYTQDELNEFDRKHYKNFSDWFDLELKKLNLSYEESKKLFYSVDRIDNDGPYAPWNCRLTTPSVQTSNQRFNDSKYIIRNILLKLLNKTFDDLMFTKCGNYVKFDTITINDRLDKKLIVRSADGKNYIKVANGK